MGNIWVAPQLHSLSDTVIRYNKYAVVTNIQY